MLGFQMYIDERIEYIETRQTLADSAIFDVAVFGGLFTIVRTSQPLNRRSGNRFWTTNMSDKVRFSRAEDDTIIKFVRTNPCLYNKRGSRLYDKPKKIRLWKELADKLGKDGECN